MVPNARMKNVGNEEGGEPEYWEYVRIHCQESVEAGRLRRQWDEEFRQLFAQNEPHRSEIRRRHEQKVQANLVVAVWRHVLDRRDRRNRIDIAMAMVLVLPPAGGLVRFLAIGNIYSDSSLPILPIAIYFHFKRSDY